MSDLAYEPLSFDPATVTDTAVAPATEANMVAEPEKVTSDPSPREKRRQEMEEEKQSKDRLAASLPKPSTVFATPTPNIDKTDPEATKGPETAAEIINNLIKTSPDPTGDPRGAHMAMLKYC